MCASIEDESPSSTADDIIMYLLTKYILPYTLHTFSYDGSRIGYPLSVMEERVLASIDVNILSLFLTIKPRSFIAYAFAMVRYIAVKS